VQLRTSGGQVLTTLDTMSNLDKSSGYRHRTYDVTPFKGRTVKLYFRASEDGRKATSFVLDGVSLAVH
jgi:hypothetical protein